MPTYEHVVVADDNTIPGKGGAALDARFANKVSDYARHVKLNYGDSWEVNTQKIQSAIDAMKITSGTVYLSPNGRAAYTADAAIEIDKITHWSRVKVIGLGPNGVRLKARAGITGSMWTCGATDGTDMNWHHGVLEQVQFDGNKANQPAAKTLPIVGISYGPVTGIPTQSYGNTVTTAEPHGLSLGDVVEVSGTSKAGAHGRFVIHQVGSPTTFVLIGMINADGATGGTARLVRNGVTVIRGGETSELSKVHVVNAVDSGFYYGRFGTPFRFIGCAAFLNGGYGYDLNMDRPVYMEAPSGDGNVLGFINAEGPVGNAFGQASLTVVSLKAEFHSSPIFTFRNWTGTAQIIGGSTEMVNGNTSPVFRRIGNEASEIEIHGFRIDMRQAGTIFDDQSSAGLSRSTAHQYAFTYNDHLTSITKKDSERFAYLGGSSPTPYIDNAANFWYRVEGSVTTGTVSAPVGYVTGFNSTIDTITFYVQNSTSGDITVNWNSVYRISGWTAPAAGKVRIVTFKRFGSTWYASSVGPEM